MKKMNKLTRKGFTFIEMMASVILISLAFLLIHRTYFTIQKNISEVEKKIKETEILFNFLNHFKLEMEGICDIENLEKKKIIFSTLISDLSYPVEIEYVVEKVENKEKLIRIQRNILNEYKFQFSVLKCENINFLFFVENEWKENIEKDILPKGIAIELNWSDRIFFCPVYLNLIKDEEK
jgi:prepilin-type N-terminal cleavage/methylation domain-containing protein